MSAPVILVGVPRSGTALLGARLGAHPAFTAPIDAPWLAGSNTLVSVRHLVTALKDDPADQDTVWEAARAFAEQVLAGRRAASGPARGEARLLIDAAEETAYLDFLLQLFPRAAYLHVRRDPRDVACDTLAGAGRPTYLPGFGPTDALTAVRRWCAWERRLRDAFAAEGAPACLRVSYEELVTAPEACRSRVHDFLGVAAGPIAPAPEAERGSAGRWEAEMDPGVVGEIDRRFGAEIEALGYPRREAGQRAALAGRAGAAPTEGADHAPPPRVLRWPFSFAFPAPRNAHQTIAYKDGPPGGAQSKVTLLPRPPKPEEEDEVGGLVEDGHYLLGISAFETWPARLHNPAGRAFNRDYDLFEKPYYRRFVGFMHHAREPRDVFPDDLPLLRMDFSDFVQVRKRGREKVYDLLCYAGYRPPQGDTTGTVWGRAVKGHDLATRIVEALLQRHPDLRVCVVNDDIPLDDPRVTHFGFLPYREFLDKVESSRVVLVASELDASPRLIAEALCLDAYVMVNERISGGWKYVHPGTGAFFDEHNYVEVFDRLRARGPAATRAWFLRNYPNHVLEERFNAWLNQCILAHSALNGFGRVYHLDAGAGAGGESMRRELYRFWGVYGDCVERIAPAPDVADPLARRARGHLTALRRARELGLPNVVIVEEGFVPIAERRVKNRRLGAFLEGFPRWGMILFGACERRADEPTHDPAVRRVLDAAPPRAYAVSAALYDRLIAAWEGARGGAWSFGGVAGEGEVYGFRAPLGD